MSKDKPKNKKKKQEPREKITKTVLNEDLHGFTLIELKVKPRKKPAYYRWLAFSNRRLDTGPKDTRILYFRSEYIIEQTHDLISAIGYVVNQHGQPLQPNLTNLNNADPVHIGVITSLLKAKVAKHEQIKRTELVVPEHIQKQREAELLDSSLSVMENEHGQETDTPDTDELPDGAGITEEVKGQGQEQPQDGGDSGEEETGSPDNIINLPRVSEPADNQRAEDGAGQDTADPSGEQGDEGNGSDLQNQSKDGENPA